MMMRIMMRMLMMMKTMTMNIIRCSSNHCLQWEGERSPRCDGKRQVGDFLSLLSSSLSLITVFDVLTSCIDLFAMYAICPIIIIDVVYHIMIMVAI